MKLHDLFAVVFLITCGVVVLLLWAHFAHGGMIIDAIQKQYVDSQRTVQPPPAPPKDQAETDFYIHGSRLFELVIQAIESQQNKPQSVDRRDK